MNKLIRIDPFSSVPLYVETMIGESETIISNGTGFIILYDSIHYLITNWHIVTARHAETGQPMSKTGAADPKSIKIYFHSATHLGFWQPLIIDLIDQTTGSKKWLEHPLGKQVDVVALPLLSNEKIIFYPMDMTLASTDLIITPSEPISIIGFPFGRLSSSFWPIWKTGHIASDIDMDYNNKQAFLIDATTKQGMSGSPVIAKRLGSFQNSKGLNVGGECIKFMGVYSGRIHEESDIGMVWKPKVIVDILSPLQSPFSYDANYKNGTVTQRYKFYI